ncbi:hypothetical protein PST407_05466 [Pseudomonas syringae pv. tomato]|uniref:Uncharacterized protein n=1 Tax=Pseudomonas syringae pv. tomato TaxID=323 RepID=A0AAV1BJR2_PSEUB|nr:hypothetical protein PSTA9_04770 [Pseudomonas syringae pv. tomato]KUR42627.1 hypothetical protein PST407_05466 [Pseudomonas syringae pv. tomato]CAI8859881.1 hypothetical protein DAPPPG215_13540 [Pseudomonas syringae pv. tomato]
MPIVTNASLLTELGRLKESIKQMPLDAPRERRSSYDKTVAAIYVLKRLGLLEVDEARRLHSTADTAIVVTATNIWPSAGAVITEASPEPLAPNS